jgi:hypothetical protein
MNHPTLHQVEDDLKRIADVVPKLAESAKWAWPLAYSRLQREQLGRAAAGDVARPVEAAVATEGAPEWVVRSEVGRAGILIGRATEFLEAAGGCLARAHAAADVAPATPPEPTGPPLVSKAELDRTRAAKVRRDERRPPGVGYGEY